MRVLAACRPRAYREAIGKAIQELRPGIEVVILDPDEVEMRHSVLDPDLVICASPDSLVSDGRSAWVEFLPYEEPAATVSLDGRREELDKVTLEDLLWVVDKTEELCRTRRDIRNR